MLIRNALSAALVLAIALPVAADTRPKPRPHAVQAAVAPEPMPRPRANPAYARLAVAPAAAVPMPVQDVAALVNSALDRSLVKEGLPAPDTALASAREPAVNGRTSPDYAAMPPDARLLEAAARGAGAYQVVTSTANAPLAPAFIAPMLRPRARPALAAAPAVLAPPVLAPALRPLPRPWQAATPPAPAASAPALLQPAVALVASMSSVRRPEPRPRGLSAAPAARGDDIVLAAVTPPLNPGKPLVRSKKGSVCGDPSIRGETIPPIPARLRGCGLAEPVRVTEIDGIRMSTPATVDCTTARAMKTWIDTGLRPAFGRKNPPVALNIAASYICRTRNNIPGNPISEHGRGKAIDISGIVLKSGDVVDVGRDYRSSKPLRAAHRAACGPFGTTLGPGSDGYHENHLHFDTANLHRPYCR